MLILTMAAAAATANPVVEAERDFALRAQRDGQWTAFRATAAPDAVMFVPEQVRAQDWLATQKDPPAAVQWHAARAFLSCDGKAGATTGSWLIPAVKLDGFYTTVWTESDGSWRWVLDHGQPLAAPRATGDVPVERRAKCGGRPNPTVLDDKPGYTRGLGHSPDKTLVWRWETRPDGSRLVEIGLWNGKAYENVVSDEIPPPAK